MIWLPTDLTDRILGRQYGQQRATGWYYASDAGGAARGIDFESAVGVLRGDNDVADTLIIRNNGGATARISEATTRV